MSLFELYTFSFLKQGVSHSCHVDKLSVPIFSAPRKDTRVSRTQKSRGSCYFLTQRWTIYNLRLTQKKGLEKGEMALRCDLDSDALETII